MTNGLQSIFLCSAMTGFSSLLAPLSAFSWAVSQEEATIGDTLRVPYITNTSGSGVFNNASGYSTDMNSITSKDVTLSQNIYQLIKIDDSTWSKLSGDTITRTATALGQALARDVISASFAAVLGESNLSASITQTNLTSSVGLASLVKQGDDLKWTPNRSMILSPEAHQYCLRNPDVNQAFAYGANAPIQSGTIPQVFGFNVSKYGGTFTTTAQPIKGVVCDTSGIIVGMGVHKPAEDSRNIVAVERMTDQNGLQLQLKRWYDPQYAQTFLVIECLVGATAGNPNGLVLLK